MGIQAAASDPVAARAGEGDGPGAGEQGASQSNGAAEPGAEFIRNGVLGRLLGLERDRTTGFGGFAFRGGEAQVVQDGLHEFDIIDLWGVLQSNRLICEAGSRHEGHGLVLVSLGLNLSVNGITTLDNKAAVSGSRHG